MPRDYRTVSYWLETSGDDLTPRPPLDGSIDVDVAILGAGFSGLWTAYYLLKKAPGLKIAIVEKEIAGFGASGRNGAWCTSQFPTSLESLSEKYGKSTAVAVNAAMIETVNEIGRVAEAEGLDIQWRRGGAMIVARGPQQLPSVDHEARVARELGLESRIRRLNKEETDARVRIAGALASLYSPDTAVIHPGRLARGLARVVERMGATIYEQTAVTDFSGGADPVLNTARGDVRAKTIVLCGEGYLSQLSKTKRQVLPVYSLITLTEPLSASDWAEIGWQGSECIESCRYSVEYLSKTADGRILFGGRGSPYRFGSVIKDDYDRDPKLIARLQEGVRTWFPRVKDVKFTHSWGGPLGWARDYMPTMRYDKTTNIATARGYTGNGVATANLAARVIADLMLEIESPITHLPPANHRSRNWEPEPFRFLGARYVLRSYNKIDRESERTGIPPPGNSLAERLTRH
jgi:glycine/D-amino acid oxidase-like deaminating enzyme